MVLSACGGGASTNDIVLPKTNVALYTTATANLNLAVGVTSSYAIGGGGGGSSFTTYTASSSASDIVTATVNGTNLLITGLKAGSATVSVKDSVGGNVDIKVTVGNSSALAILAPATLSFNLSETNGYQITGGLAPYTAVSSNIGVVSASITNSTLSVTANALGGAQIFVYDAKGASANLTATVVNKGSTAALFSSSSSAISFSLTGTSPIYQIGGGTPPYSVTSSSVDVLDVSLIDAVKYKITAKNWVTQR